jgi:hypothetical protein
MNYQLQGFSVERLINFLTALDRDVEIMIRRRPGTRKGWVAYPLRFWFWQRVGPLFLFSCSLRSGCPRCRFCTWVLGLAEAVANGGSTAAEGEPAEGVRVVELPVGGLFRRTPDEFSNRAGPRREYRNSPQAGNAEGRPYRGDGLLGTKRNR